MKVRQPKHRVMLRQENAAIRQVRRALQVPQHKLGRNITAVSVTIGMNPPIFLKQYRQVDSGTLHLARQRRPVGLDITARTGPVARSREQELLQRLVRQFRRQGPGQPGYRRACQVILHRAPPDADRPGDHPRAGTRAKVQLQNLAYPPHGQSLRRHPVFPSSIAMRQHWTQVHTDLRDVSLPECPPFFFEGWPGSDWNGGRHQIGSLAAIKS
jgi:hypothetical protein